MKRTELIKQLRDQAKAAGLELEFVRQGKAHEMWQVGTKRFTIPRHGEIGENMAKTILKQAAEGTSE